MNADARSLNECKRCGHRWFSRECSDGSLPKHCARCNSPYWDKVRRKELRVTSD